MGGCNQNCLCCHKNGYLMISLIFLLILSLTHIRFMVEGRAISKVVESTQDGREEEVVMERRSLIGSRPPRCVRKCRACGRCEAVQVPIVPPLESFTRRHSFSTIANSRGDYISNYKPMCWKCKCGDFFLNPW